MNSLKKLIVFLLPLLLTGCVLRVYPGDDTTTSSRTYDVKNHKSSPAAVGYQVPSANHHTPGYQAPTGPMPQNTPAAGVGYQANNVPPKVVEAAGVGYQAAPVKQQPSAASTPSQGTQAGVGYQASTPDNTPAKDQGSQPAGVGYQASTKEAPANVEPPKEQAAAVGYQVSKSEPEPKKPEPAKEKEPEKAAEPGFQAPTGAMPQSGATPTP